MKRLSMSKWRKIVALIVILIAFFFMGKLLYQNWREVSFESLKFNVVFLAVSLCVFLGGFPLPGFIWKANLACLGESISLIKSLRIIALSSLPRYVPGKVWGMASQVWLTKKEGIPAEKGGVCAVLYTIMNILSGLLLALIIFSFTSNHRFSKNFYFLFALIPLFFVALYPPVFMRIINFILIKLKRKSIELVPKYTQILKLLCLYILSWIIQCAGVYFLIHSFYLIKPSFLISLCGIYPAAWVIGFLSFITPGGLGIREGALSYLFSFYMPTSIGIAASIVIRIWSTIIELMLFAIFARSIRRYI